MAFYIPNHWDKRVEFWYDKTTALIRKKELGSYEIYELHGLNNLMRIRLLKYGNYQLDGDLNLKMEMILCIMDLEKSNKESREKYKGFKGRRFLRRIK